MSRWRTRGSGKQTEKKTYMYFYGFLANFSARALL